VSSLLGMRTKPRHLNRSWPRHVSACNHARTKMLRRQFRPRHPLQINPVSSYMLLRDCTLHNHNHNHSPRSLTKISFFWSRCCFPNKHIGHVCLPAMCSHAQKKSRQTRLGGYIKNLRWWLEASYIYKPDTCAVWIPEMFGFFCDAEKFVSKLCLSLQSN